MTLGTVRGTDRVALLAALDPVSQGAGTVTTGWVPVAGWDAILAVLQAGTDKSNKQVLINCRTEDLDVANDFSHVRLSATVAVAASLMSAVLLGIGNRRGAVAQAASVNEVVK